MEKPHYRQAGRIVLDDAPRASKHGRRNDQLYATAFLATGLLSRFFGVGLIPDDSVLGLSPTFFWWAVNALAMGLWMGGCYFYSRALRIPPIWALMGLLSVLGLIVMFFVSRSYNRNGRSHS